MGVSVLVLGVSGTGKSASLRNMGADDIALVNVAGKPLPFKGKFNEILESDNYNDVEKFIKSTNKKSIVIDDAQYLMGNEFMRRCTERGYDKFSEMAQNFWSLLKLIQDLPSDKIVYLFGHTELDQNGTEKFKTQGKLVDQCINVEGCCTIVLKTRVSDGEFSFVTQNSGADTVKSPIGMFPSYAIDNDLKYVDEKIRNYYELGDFLTDEDIAEIDEAAKKVDIEPEKKGRRGRSKASNSSTEEKTEDASKNDKAAEEKPRRARKKVSEEERAQVKAENDEAVANAGLEEAGEAEATDFENVEMPEIKEPPRRKSRKKDEAEEQETEETAAPRRRRRRSE